jgi:DNA anti-recombination protein RmuC
MTSGERLDHINRLIPALQAPALVEQIKEMIDEQTQKLIDADDEQARGRVKALRDLLNLPEALQYEREGLTAALSQADAAN